MRNAQRYVASPLIPLSLSFRTQFCPFSSYTLYIPQIFIDKTHHRTHRQRTQNYIKTLESEVIRLRASDGDLTQANKKLQNQVDLLQSTLLSANVPLPAGSEGSPQPGQATFTSFDMPASVTYRADNSNHERLHVTWPESPPPRPALRPPSQSAQSGPQPLPPSLELDFDSAVDNFSQDWYGTSSKPLPHLPKGPLPLSARCHAQPTLTPYKPQRLPPWTSPMRPTRIHYPAWLRNSTLQR